MRSLKLLCLTIIVINALSLEVQTNKIPIWLDTDPGCDDAIAILLALTDPRSQLVGVSTTFGNHNINSSTLNAVKVISALNITNIPVIKGASKAWKKTTYREAPVHGDGGMYGSQLLEAIFNHIEDETEGIRSIYQNLKRIHKQLRNRITLIILGPTTNIAKLFLDYPDICNSIERIIIMGGGIIGGNITPYAEFNVFTDAEALEQVIRYSDENSLHLSLVPLDTTQKAPISTDFIEDIQENTIVSKWAKNLLLQYRLSQLDFNIEHAPLHDALTVYYGLYPENFKGEMMSIMVNSDQCDDKYGQTVVSVETENVLVITDFDQDIFWQKILNSIYH